MSSDIEDWLMRTGHWSMSTGQRELVNGNCSMRTGQWGLLNEDLYMC